MPKRVPRAVVEWVGGMAQMPAFIADEGEPFRPEVLFWLSADGAIVGSMVASPAELLELACANLREAIAEPAWGKPHAPTHLRVESPELAAVLRAGFPDIEILCAPTPETVSVIEGMREHMLSMEDEDPSWLSPNVEPEAVAAFFRAAAALYRMQPWQHVPADEGALYVTLPALDVFDAPLMVIGQLGQSYGLMLFENDDDLEQFGAAMDMLDEGEEPELPPYLVLNYERGADIAPALRREIAAQHWEVASTDAYPSLVMMEPDQISRGASARELGIMQAIAIALPRLLQAEAAAMRAAWDGDEPCVRSFTVGIHGGDVEITIATVALDDEDPSDEELLSFLAEIAEGGQIDPETRQQCEDILLAPFYEGEDGQAFAEPRWARVLFDIAADKLGLTIPLIDAQDLERALFTALPNRVLVDGSQARPIIQELRAVYAYLGEECGLVLADECLAMLRSPRAIRRLEAALGSGVRKPAPTAGKFGKESKARRKPR